MPVFKSRNVERRVACVLGHLGSRLRCGLNISAHGSSRAFEFSMDPHSWSYLQQFCGEDGGESRMFQVHGLDGNHEADLTTAMLRAVLVISAQTSSNPSAIGQILIMHIWVISRGSTSPMLA